MSVVEELKEVLAMTEKARDTQVFSAIKQIRKVLSSYEKAVKGHALESQLFMIKQEIDNDLTRAKQILKAEQIEEFDIEVEYAKAEQLFTKMKDLMNTGENEKMYDLAGELGNILKLMATHVVFAKKVDEGKTSNT